MLMMKKEKEEERILKEECCARKHTHTPRSVDILAQAILIHALQPFSAQDLCTMAPKVKKPEKPTKNVPVELRGKEPPFAAPEGWEWHKVAKVKVAPATIKLVPVQLQIMLGFWKLKCSDGKWT